MSRSLRPLLVPGDDSIYSVRLLDIDSLAFTDFPDRERSPSMEDLAGPLLRKAYGFVKARTLHCISHMWILALKDVFFSAR